MNNNKKSPIYTPNPEYDFFKSNSTTDCTGAVPRPPETDDELDAYLDVYNFLPQSAITKEKSNYNNKTKQGRENI